jgi:hypothetical protein
MMNRPSSAFDSLHTQPIKSEPTDTSTDTEDSKLKQSKTPYQRNTILNTTISNPKISNNEDEEPAYESLSDDDDPSDSKASKDPNSSSISQKTRQFLYNYNLYLTFFRMETSLYSFHSG